MPSLYLPIYKITQDVALTVSNGVIKNVSDTRIVELLHSMSSNQSFKSGPLSKSMGHKHLLFPEELLAS